MEPGYNCLIIKGIITVIDITFIQSADNEQLLVCEEVFFPRETMERHLTTFSFNITQM